ncbi:hypothetical protein BGY98DRAFT_915741, partial [Russula aff. rugulosa BPL654]
DIPLAAPNRYFGHLDVNIGGRDGSRGQRASCSRWSSGLRDACGAREAVGWGMSSRVVGEGGRVVVGEVIALAVEIAEKSQIAVQARKEVVNAAYEQSLSEGLNTERRLIHITEGA